MSISLPCAKFEARDYEATSFNSEAYATLHAAVNACRQHGDLMRSAAIQQERAELVDAYVEPANGCLLYIS